MIIGSLYGVLNMIIGEENRFWRRFSALFLARFEKVPKSVFRNDSLGYAQI